MGAAKGAASLAFPDLETTPASPSSKRFGRSDEAQDFALECASLQPCRSTITCAYHLKRLAAFENGEAEERAFQVVAETRCLLRPCISLVTGRP